MLGLPIGPIVSGKIARNEKKYPKEEFVNLLGLGIVGQSLQELVRLKLDELKKNWNKELDEKYLRASLGPMAGLYLFATAALHNARKIIRR